MISSIHPRSLAAALGLLGMVVPCAGQGVTNEELQEFRFRPAGAEPESRQIALAESNKAEKKASEQLTQIRERLEALGKNLLDGGDDRLIQAAADLQTRQRTDDRA